MTGYKAREQPQLRNSLLKGETLKSHMLELFKDELGEYEGSLDNMPATETRGPSGSATAHTASRSTARLADSTVHYQPLLLTSTIAPVYPPLARANPPTTPAYSRTLDTPSFGSSPVYEHPPIVPPHDSPRSPPTRRTYLPSPSPALQESPHDENRQWSDRHKWLCHTGPSALVTSSRQNTAYKQTFFTERKRLNGCDETYVLPSPGSSLTPHVFSTSSPSHSSTSPPYLPTLPADADLQPSSSLWHPDVAVTATSPSYSTSSPAYGDPIFFSSSSTISDESLCRQNVSVPQHTKFVQNDQAGAFHRTYPPPGMRVPTYMWTSYPSYLSIGMTTLPLPAMPYTRDVVRASSGLYSTNSGAWLPTNWSNSAVRPRHRGGRPRPVDQDIVRERTTSKEHVGSVNGRFYHFAHEEAWGASLLPIHVSTPLQVSYRRAHLDDIIGQKRHNDHFRYDDLPLELKQRILMHAFEDTDSGVSCTASINLPMPEPKIHGVKHLRAMVRLPPAFKQLFVSKRFVEEALPVFIIRYGLSFTDVRLATHPSPLGYSSTSPIASAIQAITFRSQKASALDGGTRRWAHILTRLLPRALPNIRRIDIVDRYDMYWGPKEDRDAFGSLGKNLFHWAHPWATLTQAGFEALQPAHGKPQAALPEDLAELVREQASTFQVIPQAKLKKGVRVNTAPVWEGCKVQICTRLTVFCGLNERDGNLGPGVCGRLLAMIITFDRQTMEIIDVEDSDNYKDNKSYRFWRRLHLVATESPRRTDVGASRSKGR